MGNSGNVPKPEPVPATPMPIEDSIQAKQEAAQMVASRNSSASRVANDLNQDSASKAEAVTRNQLAKAETFAPQPGQRGPKGGPRGPRAPGSVLGAGMSSSAVLTG